MLWIKHMDAIHCLLTLSLTKGLQGRLVTQGVLARLGDELETGVDRLDVLLGLLDSRSHC